MRVFQSACCALLLLVAACSEPPDHITANLGRNGTAALYWAAFHLSTPPLNTIVFGPCDEEFGMPDTRKANCELHYRLYGQVSPWEQRRAVMAATAYQPGELACWRTRGEIAECAVVSGPPHLAPRIVAPNNLGSE